MIDIVILTLCDDGRSKIVEVMMGCDASATAVVWIISRATMTGTMVWMIPHVILMGCDSGASSRYRPASTLAAVRAIPQVKLLLMQRAACAAWVGGVCTGRAAGGVVELRRVFERGCGVAAMSGMGGAGMSDAAGGDGACSCGVSGLGASGGGAAAQSSGGISVFAPWLNAVLVRALRDCQLQRCGHDWGPIHAPP